MIKIKEKFINLCKYIVFEDWRYGVVLFGTFIVFCFMIEAIFFTPLERWTWGFTNKKLEITMIITLGVWCLENQRQIYNLRKKK